MDFKSILLIAIVIILLYVIYLFISGNSLDQTLIKVQDARAQQIIAAGSLPSGATSNYTFSIWFYINDWNYRYGQAKTIFGRIDQDSGAAPLVQLAPSINNIDVTLATYPATGSSNTSINTNCNLSDVPLQRWTNLIVTLNDRALDLYLDGKLVKTCLLPGVPKMNPASNIYVCPEGGFSGYISNFRYIANSVSPTEAYDIYKSGYSGTSAISSVFDKYRIKFAFVEDNKEVTSLEL